MAAKSQSLKQPINILPLSQEEEEALIYSRITNDERTLRRLTKKFHNYLSAAYPSSIENLSSTLPSPEEARESFLIELASFQLLLRKDRMACDAETRQINVYKQESQRIANERVALRNQIEELKLALEQAQLERRRKMEYDQTAEKINTLPTRHELELSISSSENDIQIIKDEHEAQNHSILARKAALQAIVVDIGSLKSLGKDAQRIDASASRASSEPPEAEGAAAAPGLSMDVDVAEGVATSDTGAMTTADETTKGSSALNLSAKSFSPRLSNSLLSLATQNLRAVHSASGLSNSGVTPSASQDATPVFTPLGGLDGGPLSPAESSSSLSDAEKREDGEEGEEQEDIEMGEVSEDKSGTKEKKVAEDREEGEASDESSELSEPPDE